MIKIQYASDLHLEFTENGSFLKNNPMIAVGDILVLAGDIGYIGDDNYDKHPFWDWASENFRQVIVVPGNHEFYKMFDIDKLYNGWCYSIRKNVCCYYNSIIKLDKNIEIIVTTLWSEIKIQNAYTTENAISDFRRIRYGSNFLDWKRFNAEHYRCMNFLKTSVTKSKAKHLIVVSHHVPSFKLMSSEFNGSPLNGAFTVELEDYISSSSIEYWIYGLSHRNIDGIIGNTKCVTNQLGYVFQNEHLTFNLGKVIQIYS